MNARHFVEAQQYNLTTEGAFKSNFLFNLWGEDSLAKSAGSLAVPLL